MQISLQLVLVELQANNRPLAKVSFARVGKRLKGKGERNKKMGKG
jgi:hypothetical protein